MRSSSLSLSSITSAKDGRDSGLDPVSVAGEEMGVFGIEIERDAVGDPVCLESFDAHAEPISGDCKTVEMSHVAEMFHHFEVNRTDAFAVFADRQMFGTYPKSHG